MEQSRHKIVLVDDNMATLTQGKNLLKPFYRVYTVQSAATLFENLEEDIPDLILLDVEMPDMDGFETIKKLKADVRYKNIPVIFLTSKSDEESERKGFALGAVDYIGKPFSEPLLLKRISNQILYDRIQSAVRDYAKDFEAMSYEIIKETRRAEMAEESNKAKSMFLDKMSHEIRTPMNSIIGFLELAQQADDAPPQIKKYLDKIHENADWLLAIINDILDISKVESGKIELECAPFDLQDIITHCQTVIAPQAEDKSLRLRLNIDPAANKILIGDSVKLRQVLLNILTNAVKFTTEGSIDFNVTVLNFAHGKMTIRFEVKDTGIGIDYEQMQRIFDPFMQADNSITRKFGGTGLGLAIAKSYVEMMDGEMKVESVPDKGSEFSFELKFDMVRDADLSSYKIDPHDFKPPLFDAEVLVCEDNEMNQEVICEHLKRVGIKSIVAENGRQAVDVVKERARSGKSFDLIFMDIHMPVMDGFEATAQMIGLGIQTPIIAMTANVMAQELESYKSSGMSEALGKPFKTQDLWKILKKYLLTTSVSEISESQAISENETMLKNLRINFVKSNRTTYRDIMNALDDGDIKLAHRLAHTLKSNAAQIGETALQNAAADIESALALDKDLLTDAKCAALDAVLSMVIEKINNELAAEPQVPLPKIFDKEKIRKLFDNLGQMLGNRNPECMKLLDEIRAVAGTEELARHVENFEFKQAILELEKIRGENR